MRTIAMTFIFVVAVWMISVSLYSMYETFRLNEGSEVLNFIRHKEGLLKCLNVALPTAVGCVLFLLYTHKTTPVHLELLMLGLACLALASMLAFNASKSVFPTSGAGQLNNLVWWLPDVDVPEY